MARGPRVKKARRLRRGGESEPCRCLPAWTALAGSPINLCSRTQIGHITPSPRTNANEAHVGGRHRERDLLPGQTNREG